MGLKAVPDFKLVVGSADVTARVRDRLQSIVVIDNSGEESDTVEIVIDDRGNLVESPRKGAVLDVSLGWLGDELFHLGKFTVDEVEPSGPPDILTIRGKAADMRQGFKAQRSRSFRDTTIGAIVARIATENGLTPACAESLKATPIAHRDQTNESDLHFLTRLGRDYGAVAAPKDGRLVFAPASTGLSASGQSLGRVTLGRADLTTWRGLAADRDGHGRVRARWRDPRTARTRIASAGSGDPTKTLRNLYPNEAAAKAAAEAELSRLKGGEAGVELTLPGRAALVAQTPITVTGLRAELAGDWIVSTAEHRAMFDGEGFVTRITGRRKAT